MAKKKKMKKVEKEIPVPNVKPKWREINLAEELNGFVDRIESLEQRIDRLVNVLSKGNKNFKDI